MSGDIFLVDDNPDNLNLLARILRERGYRVRMATGGRRALAAVRAAPPELIMLDITMPEMDGYEVCQELKADRLTSEIPILFISALDDVRDKIRAFETGGVDYVSKPFHAGEVLARVENQLKIFRLQQELSRRNEELVRKNRELLRAQRRTRQAFSALTEVLPGTLLDGKYQLEEKIGTGGFGAVFRARHISLDREVAVKVLRPVAANDTREGLERFRREGVSTSRLDHPNAVNVLDFGVSQDGIPYLVMELLRGHSLSHELNRTGRLSLSRAAEVVVPVCRVLAAAHSAGVVHRDIKPDNVFLHTSREGEVVKVLDFGLASLRWEDETLELEARAQAGEVLGTPSYISPEQLRNHATDGRSDIYSLGVMAYRILTGRLPFRVTDEKGNTQEPLSHDEIKKLFLMHLTEAPEPPRKTRPEIPEALERVVLRALSKSADRRPSLAEIAWQFHSAASADVVAPIHKTQEDFDKLFGEPPTQPHAVEVVPRTPLEPTRPSRAFPNEKPGRKADEPSEPTIAMGDERG